MPDLTPPLPAGCWRVNIDVRHGTVTARPGTSPLALTGTLTAAGVPVAVIDLDRSTGDTRSTALLERVARSRPGQVWAGGRLSPAGPEARRLLDAGAAGVIISGSALFTPAGPDSGGLRALAAFPEPGRLAAAVDVLDGHLMLHGFTTPSAVTASEALDAVTRAADGRCPVLYTDVAAATRRWLPNWDLLGRLAGQHPGAGIWYAGGISSWGDARRAWSLGLGVVTGRAYLTGSLGLPPSE